MRACNVYYSNSKSKRHLRLLVFLLLNVLPVRLRRLDPRRLDVIFDLKPELIIICPLCPVVSYPAGAALREMTIEATTQAIA